MKKILVVSEVFWPENFLINDLVIQLKNKGFKVDILTQHPSYPYGKVYDNYDNCDFYCEEWNGSTIYRFKVIEGYKDSTIKKLLNYFYFVYKGRKIARSITEKYDVVFVSQTGPLSVALPGIAYAKRNKSKLYLWVLDIWPDAVYAYGFKKSKLLDSLLGKFIRYVYAKSDKIFISSKKFADSISPYTNKKAFYMPNWLVKSEDSPSSIKLDTSKFNFTFTGNVSLYQNLDNVIKGFHLAKLDNCILNFVGDGSWLDNLKKLVEENDIKNVVFHGRHPASEMHDVLTQSNTLILPLIPDEGIQKTEPLKLQSYLRSGKPILGVIGGSGKEIIEENQLGLCADPENIEDIAKKFKEVILFSQNNAQNVAESSENLINTRFNCDIILDDFIKIL
ncbi:MAG: glycosyltransferase family 4 protein [Rikenellaceae bacterium]